MNKQDDINEDLRNENENRELASNFQIKFSC